ncbi:MAG: hypothetical protein ACRDP6_42090 [Actinoallomurus sp.]
MTSQYRKRRGAETQRLTAAAWRGDGWPFCEDAGAGRNGKDLLGTPGLSVEIKARRDFSPLAWMKQAAGEDGIPIVVMRPDGAGPASVDNWPAFIRHADLRRLLRLAGYGNPLEEPEADGA